MFEIESVELPAVVTNEKVAVRVTDVARNHTDRRERDRRAVAALTDPDGVGAGKTVEEVVERPIFLDDNDDVLDERI